MVRPIPRMQNNIDLNEGQGNNGLELNVGWGDTSTNLKATCKNELVDFPWSEF